MIRRLLVVVALLCGLKREEAEDELRAVAAPEAIGEDALWALEPRFVRETVPRLSRT